jgi:hypothetical protein
MKTSLFVISIAMLIFVGIAIVGILADPVGVYGTTYLLLFGITFQSVLAIFVAKDKENK